MIKKMLILSFLLAQTTANPLGDYRTNSTEGHKQLKHHANFRNKSLKNRMAAAFDDIFQAIINRITNPIERVFYSQGTITQPIGPTPDVYYRSNATPVPPAGPVLTINGILSTGGGLGNVTLSPAAAYSVSGGTVTITAPGTITGFTASSDLILLPNQPVTEVTFDCNIEHPNQHGLTIGYQTILNGYYEKIITTGTDSIFTISAPFYVNDYFLVDGVSHTFEISVYALFSVINDIEFRNLTKSTFTIEPIFISPLGIMESTAGNISFQSFNVSNADVFSLVGSIEALAGEVRFQDITCDSGTVFNAGTIEAQTITFQDNSCDPDGVNNAGTLQANDIYFINNVGASSYGVYNGAAASMIGTLHLDQDCSSTIQTFHNDGAALSILTANLNNVGGCANFGLTVI